ncbi:hypothetical protein [Aquimarina sp. RZ0]|uniref:hypothetical protein n=1 Tax=Aquimarina sp. RZ0 TaxID=2607730 RepID=UPI0011F2611E|nr:hypothetical protein [Aquimarina sp. RZ0]KAA1239860.1 hypothetical protein F0000_27160 [Aquimarina sp. RZ0]
MNLIGAGKGGAKAITNHIKSLNNRIVVDSLNSNSTGFYKSQSFGTDPSSHDLTYPPKKKKTGEASSSVRPPEKKGKTSPENNKRKRGNRFCKLC